MDERQLNIKPKWNYWYDAEDRAIIEVEFEWVPDIVGQWLDDPYRNLFGRMLWNIGEAINGGEHHFTIERVSRDGDIEQVSTGRMHERNPAYVLVSVPTIDDEPDPAALGRLRDAIVTEKAKFIAEGRVLSPGTVTG